MPSLHPSLTQVTTAERPGGDRPSQDRIFTTCNAVIVLDGASHPDPADRDGRWIADRIGQEVHRRLRNEPTADLRTTLAGAIGDTAQRHSLKPGSSPSTTVSIVRWHAGSLDVLVLCDSPVVVVDRSGTVHEIRDERLRYVNDALGRPTGFQSQNRDGWRAFVLRQQEHRNRASGYWVAEADPRAAHHAVLASWPLDQVMGVLAMTDGVSKGVDTYSTPPTWRDAFCVAVRDPALLVDVVHEAERSDPNGLRWPRSKRHDDKALAVVRFAAE